MKVEQRSYSAASGWRVRSSALEGKPAQLVLVFGERDTLEQPERLAELRAMYPGAKVLLSSAAGVITDVEVDDGVLVATAVAFDRTKIATAITQVANPDESYEAGRTLAEALKGPELKHVFVVSDGQLVNGTELARGLGENLPVDSVLTGGLAGDGTRFERTVVGLDEPPRPGRVAAIGFYGAHIRVGFGSAGGWESFGPERLVTRSEGNALSELDGQPALRLYKTYLGDQAEHLPGSALRFPLCVTAPGGRSPVVRTILSIDPEERMIFAGDIPQGSRVRFMRASYEDLIDGAAQAAEQTLDGLPRPELAICVSCVGRRIVLGQRTEEEPEVVRSTLGAAPVLTGFYSYGELAPAGSSLPCQLHNQTMTITTLREED